MVACGRDSLNKRFDFFEKYEYFKDKNKKFGDIFVEDMRKSYIAKFSQAFLNLLKNQDKEKQCLIGGGTRKKFVELMKDLVRYDDTRDPIQDFFKIYKFPEREAFVESYSFMTTLLLNYKALPIYSLLFLFSEPKEKKKERVKKRKKPLLTLST